MSDRLFASGAEAAIWAAGLPEWVPGRRHFEYVTSTSSTQDMAFAAAKRGAPSGSLFLAEEQRAGRGRHGSTWVDAAGKSLLFSVLLSGDVVSEGGGRIPLGAALAVCRAVEELCDAAPAVKWPNDLVLGRRKFGGVLTEVRGGTAVLGVGINVLQGQADFPAELAGRAVSLAAECPGMVGRVPLLEAVLDQLSLLLGPGHQSWEEIAAGVAERLAWTGRQVRVGALQGAVSGISREGHLMLTGRDGRKLVAVSGSPELIEP
mgnify:CR=1 FL=1